MKLNAYESSRKPVIKRAGLWTAGLLLLCAAASSCRHQAPMPGGSTGKAEAAATVAPGPNHQKSGPASGHAMTVRCLRGERAMSDGDELRCEDWSYVSNNYR